MSLFDSLASLWIRLHGDLPAASPEDLAPFLPLLLHLTKQGRLTQPLKVDMSLPGVRVAVEVAGVSSAEWSRVWEICEEEWSDVDSEAASNSGVVFETAETGSGRLQLVLSCVQAACRNADLQVCLLTRVS